MSYLIEYDDEPGHEFSMDAVGPVAFAHITTAPEPGTWVLLGTGLTGVAAVTARRRRLTT